MPSSVSASRTGALPSRGSGVTVFVTKASSCRAVSGAVSPSRQPEALSSTAVRPPSSSGNGHTAAEFSSEIPPRIRGRRSFLSDPDVGFGAFTLDTRSAPKDGPSTQSRFNRRRSRSRSRSTRRSRKPSALPRRAARRRDPLDGAEHRLGPAGEDVVARRDDLRHEHGVDHDLRARQQRGSLGVMLAAEAEHGRGLPERLRQVRERRDADSSADQQRPRDVESKPLPSGPSTWIAAPGSSAQSARVPRPSGSMRNASSPGGARQRLIGRGSSRPGASSMKNCPGRPGSSSPRSTRSSVYGPTLSRPVTLSSCAASQRLFHRWRTRE